MRRRPLNIVCFRPPVSRAKTSVKKPSRWIDFHLHNSCLMSSFLCQTPGWLSCRWDSGVFCRAYFRSFLDRSIGYIRYRSGQNSCCLHTRATRQRLFCGDRHRSNFVLGQKCRKTNTRWAVQQQIEISFSFLPLKTLRGINYHLELNGGGEWLLLVYLKKSPPRCRMVSIMDWRHHTPSMNYSGASRSVCVNITKALPLPVNIHPI